MYIFPNMARCTVKFPVTVTMPCWWLIALTMGIDYHAVHCLYEWEFTDGNIK